MRRLRPAAHSARPCQHEGRDSLPLLLGILLLLVVGPGRLAEAQGVWASGGPEGGTVTALATSGTEVVFAALYPGDLYRSTDQGLSWTRLSHPWLDKSAVADVDVGADGTVYVTAGFGSASGNCNGLLVSHDAGLSWICRAPDLNTYWVGGRLSLGPRGVAYLEYGGGGLLYRIQLEQAWLPSDRVGPPSTEGRIAAVSVASDGTVYAGTSLVPYGPGLPTGTVFRSANTGTDWTNAGTGLPGGAVTALATFGDAAVFAGIRGGGIYASTNRGESWQPANVGLGELDTLSVDALVAVDGHTLLAGTTRGVFHSDNGGASWTQASGPVSRQAIGALAHAVGGHWYAGSAGDGGVFRTAAAGAWLEANSGLRAVTAQRIVTRAADEAWTSGVAIHRTIDAGATWQRVHDGFPLDRLTAFALAPDGAAYAAWAGAGLFRSIDYGATWVRLEPPWVPVTALAVDAKGTVYEAGGSDTEPRVARSTDGGQTWASGPKPAFSFGLGSIQVIAPSPAGLVAARSGYGGNSMTRSGDGGLAWELVSLPLGCGNPTPPLAVDAAGRVWAWAGYLNPLHWSADGGATWTPVSTPAVSSCALVAAGPTALYFAPWPSTTVLSRPADADVGWTDLAFTGAAGGAAALGPSAIAVAQHAPWRVYVAAPGRGIFTLVPDQHDEDEDGLPDAWERLHGLDPSSADGDDGAGGDPDRDGIDNRTEYASGTHPRGTVRRYFAEGAAGDSRSDTRYSFFNPGHDQASVVLTHILDDGRQVKGAVAVPAGGVASLSTTAVSLMAGGSRPGLSTVVESDDEVVADRWVDWGGGEGSHLESATLAPSTTWYLAEGATHSGFSLFYLLLNPGPAAADVDITYLRPSPLSSLRRRLTLPALSRVSIDVATEAFEGVDGLPLSNTDVSAVVSVVTGPPVVVERTMYYWQHASRVAGHASAAVATPSQRWWFAEGATGSYFDMFLLLANVNDAPADVKVTYLLPDGAPEERVYRVAPRSRSTVWVDFEGARLADSAVAMVVESTNGVPIVAERSMYWPGWYGFSAWTEAHNSAGVTDTGTLWALAGGDLSEAHGVYDTYVLVANVSAAEARIRVTAVAEHTGERVSREWTVPPMSRFNVPMRDDFPELAGHRFGALVESVPVGEGLVATPVVVEWSVYGPGPFTYGWALGGAARATRLR